MDGGRINKQVRHDRMTQRIAQAVGHGVVNGDVALNRLSRWTRAKVWHATRKRGCHGKTARIGVVFHVILWRMGEDDRGRHIANYGRKFSKRAQVVEDFEIVAKARVIRRGHNGGGALRLSSSDGAELCRTDREASARTAAQCHVMNVEARLLKKQEGAGHVELDVVGVCTDREGGGRASRCGN